MNIYIHVSVFARGIENSDLYHPIWYHEWALNLTCQVYLLVEHFKAPQTKLIIWNSKNDICIVLSDI